MAHRIMRLLILMLLFFTSGCWTDNEGMTPDLPIDKSEPRYNKGDCLLFETDSNKYISAVVINITKDEGGIWYGLCCTDLSDSKVPQLAEIKSSRLSGRKIESALEPKGFVIAADLIYMSDSCIKSLIGKIKLMASLKLKPNVFEGLMSPTTDFTNFIVQYEGGKENRKLPPDDYRNHFNPRNRPEEYISIAEFVDR